MTRIEVIPVIELPTRDWERAGKLPQRPYSKYALEWEKYWNELQKVSGYEQQYERISMGQCLYRVNQFSNLNDLALIIDRHLHPGNDNEAVPIIKSTPLFGGYVLKVNDEFKLYPQCCCDLGDLLNWTSILNDDYKSNYLFSISTGHPQPLVTKSNSQIKFICEEDMGETFSPATDKEIIIDEPPLRLALEKTNNELLVFANQIDKLSAKYGVERLSEYLIARTK